VSIEHRVPAQQPSGLLEIRILGLGGTVLKKKSKNSKERKSGE